MISHKYKFIFIHIPKTGGTSIDCLFTGSMQRHSCMQDYESYLSKKQFGEYLKFTIVRNPFDLMVSSYIMICKRIASHHKHTIKTFGDNIFTFNEYINKKVQNYIVGTEDFIETNFSKSMFNGNQLDWIQNLEGKLTIDYIARFENLQEDFDIIFDKIGIPRQKLPHKNKTDHKHYTEYYDDETKQIVAEKYAKDIEYFGYKFGE